MTDPCPECAKRPYLCFEHNEEQRAREEDELTLTLFAARWEARLAREEDYKARLAKSAYFTGRSVAQEQMTPERAARHLETMGAAIDPDLAEFKIRLLDYETAQKIIAEAFYEGMAHGQR